MKRKTGVNEKKKRKKKKQIKERITNGIIRDTVH